MQLYYSDNLVAEWRLGLAGSVVPQLISSISLKAESVERDGTKSSSTVAGSLISTLEDLPHDVYKNQADCRPQAVRSGTVFWRRTTASSRLPHFFGRCHGMLQNKSTK